MIPLLAQTPTLMGVDVGVLVTVGGALAVFFKLWKKICSVEESVAKRIKTMIMAESAEAEKNGTIKPQPLIVSMAKEFVGRESYNTHCSINRSEHGRIEKEFGAKVEKITDLHYDLAREVSGVNTLAETTNANMQLLGQKVDNFIMELRRERK